MSDQGALERPTFIRWRILALLMAYAGLVHFNRISISVAGTEHIMKDYAINETQMGMVYTSYLIVYTLCMTPGGWLIDRFGPKRALLFLGFGSAIVVPMTGMTGLSELTGPLSAVMMLSMLCVIRGLLGVMSTPMHPAAARSVSFWMPVHVRGMANGLVTGAAVIGIAATYFVFGFLMDQIGWPSAFFIAGGVTLLLTILWSIGAADRPRQHPAVNAGERRLIEGASESVAKAERAYPSPTKPNSAESSVYASDGPSPHSFGDFSEQRLADEAHDSATTHSERSLDIEKVGFLSLLRNRGLVLLTASYAAYSYFQYLFFYWMQYYFDEVLKLGNADGRLYSTITILAMAVGMMVGGWLMDRMRCHFGGWLGRAITPMIAMSASSGLLMMGIFSSEPAWVVTCFALSMGALGATESSFWTTGIELGKHRGGLSGAILNTGGNAGGLLAPIITPLFSAYFGWQAGLGLASFFCLLGAALWWWIDTDD